jgi:DNA mismatch repair protein MSH6
MQLTPLSGIDFSDASQIRMLIHSKGFFNASTESWLSALDCAVNRDVVICALGGLIGHLTRLMVYLAYLFLPLNTFISHLNRLCHL